MAEVQRTYHHGDLAEALIGAVLDLARAGGAAAVSVRAVTRSAGVSPAALYRHFPDHQALLRAAARRTQRALADAMLAVQDELGPAGDPAQDAVRLLRGVGLGYVRYALDEPGWFDLAFSTPDDPGTPPPDEPGPYGLLVEALDALAAAGVLPAERREGADWTCWASVHGFCDLASRGPLRDQPRTVIDTLARRVVDDVIAGIATGDVAAARPGATWRPAN